MDTVEDFRRALADDTSDDWKAIYKMEISHPIIKYLLSRAITMLAREQRHHNRKLVKKGRATEITSLKAREFATQSVQEWEAIGEKYSLLLGNQIHDVLRQHENSILATWIFRGRPLGYATPEALREEARAEEQSARGHHQNATFYRRLAKLGKKGTPIATTVSAAVVDRISREVFVATINQFEKTRLVAHTP